MRRRLWLLITAGALLVILLVFHTGIKQAKGLSQRVIVSTAQSSVDLQKVRGIVWAKNVVGDIDAINRSLEVLARQRGGDTVTGVLYISHNGYLYGYGTVVER
jgi:hypothetical protein